MQTSVTKYLGIGAVLFALGFFVWTYDRNILLLPSTSDAPPPNIVIIDIDSLRADHMGTYGYERPTTPFLDSLFAKGVTFNSLMTPGILTYQTDASLFTSLYPSQHNMIMWHTPLRKDVPTLAEILKTFGYHTSAYVSPSLYKSFLIDRGFDVYETTLRSKNIEVRKDEVAHAFASAKGPFFLFWHIYDVHLTYEAPKPPFAHEYTGIFSNKKYLWQWSTQSTTSVKGAEFADDFDRKPGETVYGGPPFDYIIRPDDIQYEIDSYDTGVRHVDDALKSFFLNISTSTNYSNTLFIITGEHGDDLKEHGYIFHRDLYDVNIHTPLALIYPERLRPGRVQTPVSTLDLLPTLLSLLSIPIPAHAEGKDLTGLLSGKSLDRTYIFSEREPFREYAVRKGDWKYIMRNRERIYPDMNDGLPHNFFFKNIVKNDETYVDELYNLRTDPNEQTNLIGKNPLLDRELSTVLNAFKQKMIAAREENRRDPPIEENSVLIPYF